TRDPRPDRRNRGLYRLNSLWCDQLFIASVRFWVGYLLHISYLLRKGVLVLSMPQATHFSSCETPLRGLMIGLAFSLPAAIASRSEAALSRGCGSLAVAPGASLPEA